MTVFDSSSMDSRCYRGLRERVELASDRFIYFCYPLQKQFFFVAYSTLKSFCREKVSIFPGRLQVYCWWADMGLAFFWSLVMFLDLFHTTRWSNIIKREIQFPMTRLSLLVISTQLVLKTWITFLVVSLPLQVIFPRSFVGSQAMTSTLIHLLLYYFKYYQWGRKYKREHKISSNAKTKQKENENKKQKTEDSKTNDQSQDL